MNLNTLTMFDAAARHLNFRLAAQELFLTQGAVAQRIRKLEQDLGVQLFQRHARGIRLTEKGERYHQAVREALSLVNNATRELTGCTAELTISAPPSVVTKWLMPRLAEFCARYPDINVRISASEKLTDFDQEDVDLAVRQGQAPDEKNLDYKRLADLSLLIVCAPDFLAENQIPTSMTDFADLKLIEDGHRSWEQLLGRRPEQALNLSHSHLAIDAAVNHQGIALVPGILVEQELATGKLTIIHQPATVKEQGLYLIWRKNGDETNPVISLLTRWLSPD